MRAATTTTPVAVKLDVEIRDRMKRLADSRHRTTHWLMREAIQQYVEREEAREDFKQEALASWKELQETGLHLTGPEVGDWLRSWGTESESEPPKCHE